MLTSVAIRPLSSSFSGVDSYPQAGSSGAAQVSSLCTDSVCCFLFLRVARPWTLPSQGILLLYLHHCAYIGHTPLCVYWSYTIVGILLMYLHHCGIVHVPTPLWVYWSCIYIIVGILVMYLHHCGYIGHVSTPLWVMYHNPGHIIMV